MANKRVSLSERRERDSAKGVDLFFNPVGGTESSTQSSTQSPDASAVPADESQAVTSAETGGGLPKAEVAPTRTAPTRTGPSDAIASIASTPNVSTPNVLTPDVSKSSVSTPGVSTSNAGVPSSAPSAKPILAKATIYVRPDQIVAIERIQLEERLKTGKKPDKSDLVQEALDLLIQKYQ